MGSQHTLKRQACTGTAVSANTSTQQRRKAVGGSWEMADTARQGRAGTRDEGVDWSSAETVRRRTKSVRTGRLRHGSPIPADQREKDRRAVLSDDRLHLLCSVADWSS